MVPAVQVLTAGCMVVPGTWCRTGTWVHMHVCTWVYTTWVHIVSFLANVLNGLPVIWLIWLNLAKIWPKSGPFWPITGAPLSSFGQNDHFCRHARLAMPDMPDMPDVADVARRVRKCQNGQSPCLIDS